MNRWSYSTCLGIKLKFENHLMPFVFSAKLNKYVAERNTYTIQNIKPPSQCAGISVSTINDINMTTHTLNIPTEKAKRKLWKTNYSNYKKR